MAVYSDEALSALLCLYLESNGNAAFISELEHAAGRHLAALETAWIDLEGKAAFEEYC